MLLASLPPLALAAASCSRATPESAARAAAPERYRYLQEVVVSDEDLPEVRAALPYERIELSEFNPWFMGGPTIVLERDGAASQAGSPPKSGQVSIFDFGGLCYLIERIGFESLEPRYAWSGFDATTFTLKVWRAGGDRPIAVEDYGGVGPLDLWTLRAAIEGVAARVDWK